MVDDLHKLLGAAEIPGPYVLVGHSFGGLLMRLYASRHRDEVAGLVLVDSMHEDQFDVFGEMFPPPSPADPLALRQTRARRVELQRRWEDLQKQFLELSCRATQSIVHGSGHFVQRDDPQVVIDAIRAMIGHAAASVAGPTAS
jgi:pimeloyl-ACP methyl ester carboxylesterase